MSKKSKTTKKHHKLTALQLSFTFISFLAVNSLILYFANSIFPQHVVLGTHLFSPLSALFYSAVVITLIVVGSMQVVYAIIERQKLRLSNVNWIVLYFFINIGTVWLVSRFAEQFGMGISCWCTAILLGSVLNLGQLVAHKCAIAGCKRK